MSVQPLKIAFSPCPNDTFMFDGLVNQRLINNVPVAFDLLDIEQLNTSALAARYDVTKLSYAMYPQVAASYEILSSGSAIGHKCGPLLIALPNTHLADITHKTIAIPGKYTTANLLLSVLFPHLKQKQEILFSDIENAVLKGTVAAGVIIHENRFTYAQKGLIKLADLGDDWEESTGFPIPLGCVVVKRSLPLDVKFSIQRALRESVELAFSDRSLSAAFVNANAQEMSNEVQQQHINLYVNELSIDLGKTGSDAVRNLFSRGQQQGLLPAIKDSLFLNDSFINS